MMFVSVVIYNLSPYLFLGHAHYHKELMGHETALFLALFPKFVFSFGQIEQEFSKVTPSTYKSHLFRTKGTAKTKQIFREGILNL